MWFILALNPNCAPYCMSRFFVSFLLASVLFTHTTAMSSEQTYLALGDSYTIGESVTAQERWPAQLVKVLRTNGRMFNEPVVIAKTGWRTDDLKAAIDKAQLKNGFDLVSLSIGVNNQYQGKPADQYGPEFEDLLLTAIRLAKGVKGNVFVVSIPDYGYTPFGRPKQAQITPALDQFNAINASITKKHGVMYFNITDISRQGFEHPDWVAADGLHPSAKMYALWVERIASGLTAASK
jgi:lysophospholipase L1-like esterase